MHTSLLVKVLPLTEFTVTSILGCGATDAFLTGEAETSSDATPRVEELEAAVPSVLVGRKPAAQSLSSIPPLSSCTSFII